MPKLLENSDGSAVVVLDDEVRFKGDEIVRVTIPALRGKHMRLITWDAASGSATGGQLAEFAAQVVTPAGVFDELTPRDALYVTQAVNNLLGKALLPTGASASSSSPEKAAAPSPS